MLTLLSPSTNETTTNVNRRSPKTRKRTSKCTEQRRKILLKSHRLKLMSQHRNKPLKNLRKQLKRLMLRKKLKRFLRKHLNLRLLNQNKRASLKSPRLRSLPDRCLACLVWCLWCRWCRCSSSSRILVSRWHSSSRISTTNNSSLCNNRQFSNITSSWCKFTYLTSRMLAQVPRELKILWCKCHPWCQWCLARCHSNHSNRTPNLTPRTDLITDKKSELANLLNTSETPKPTTNWCAAISTDTCVTNNVLTRVELTYSDAYKEFFRWFRNKIVQ